MAAGVDTSQLRSRVTHTGFRAPVLQLLIPKFRIMGSTLELFRRFSDGPDLPIPRMVLL